MGLPRFKPAHMCANPRNFGRHKQPEPADPNPLDAAQTAWAIFQHRASYAVIEELNAAEHTIEHLAEQLDLDPAWLQRKLYGQTPATLGDIMTWTLHYGIHILPTFDNGGELKHPQS